MAKKFVPQTEPLSAEEIQEQTRFRMEKLKALQAEGKDPYEELTYDVTNHSGRRDKCEHHDDDDDYRTPDK